MTDGVKTKEREGEQRMRDPVRDNRKTEERKKKVADYFSILSHARMAILPLLQLSPRLSDTLLLFRDPFVFGQKNS